MLSSFSSSLLGGTLFLAALAEITDAYIPGESDGSVAVAQANPSSHANRGCFDGALVISSAQAVNNTASLSNRTDSSSLNFAWVQVSSGVGRTDGLLVWRKGWRNYDCSHTRD